MITLKEGFIWLSKVAFDHTDVADLMTLDETPAPPPLQVEKKLTLGKKKHRSRSKM